MSGENCSEVIAGAFKRTRSRIDGRWSEWPCQVAISGVLQSKRSLSSNHPSRAEAHGDKVAPGSDHMPCVLKSPAIRVGTRGSSS